MAREREARAAAERIAEDGTRELYQRSRHLELLETVAAHANGCDDPFEVLALTLRQICEFCDWPVGHAMAPAAEEGLDNPVLVSTGHFHAGETASYRVFETASRASRFSCGQGLPGRVWLTGEPVWVEDVFFDDNFPRLLAARACGLHAGFGLPVRLGAEVVMVLEFFSPRRLELDPVLLQTLGQACAQVARVLERARARRETEDARRAAEQASETKSRFLANMSHEIRTPLNGMLGMIQAMEREEMAEVQRRRLEVVRQSGRGLLAILNDLLDLSKVEAGALELERTPFDLPELLASVVAVFRPSAEAKGVALGLKLADDFGPWRQGDPTRLRQLVQNLLSNALKFTDAGEVSLSVSDARPDRIRLVVADTGIGIAPDQHEAIFASFVQADDSITRRFGGTGLGLSICRQLALAMDGEITVESRLGEGSTFAVELSLPACPSPQAPEDRDHDPHVDALRVLAAEDNPVNRMVLEALLADSGVELVLVTNGQEALETWREDQFDLVLMDVQMPVLDGPGAARAIREEETRRVRARTPILALTANTMTHQIDQYLAAGMDGVVSKPIEIADLFKAMEAALSPPCVDA